MSLYVGITDMKKSRYFETPEQKRKRKEVAKYKRNKKISCN
jgi:small subunit ribosomal protein S21